MIFKIGSSIDIHRLEEGYDLILGGVKIDHNKGLVGHSDADCLLHAVTEAIIGALGLGDLGEHFPDTDPKYKGVNSSVLLEEAKGLLEQHGYQIGNIDTLILCEKPKISPHKQIMKKNIAEILEIDETLINIKATRGEKLGFIGKEEGIVANATVLINKIN